MRNRNYGRMLLTGLVVGVCGLCWVQSGSAETHNSGSTYRIFDVTITLDSGSTELKTGVFVEAAHVTANVDWIDNVQLYVYNNGILRSTGNMKFNYAELNWDSLVVKATDKSPKIVVGGSADGTGYDYEYRRDGSWIKPVVKEAGTLIVNGTVLTTNLIINQQGTFISSGTGESTVGTLTGSGEIRLYVDKGKVGKLTVTGEASFSGSVYIGLDGVANIANFKPQDVLSSKVFNKEVSKITTSEFFDCVVNGDYYQISLKNMQHDKYNVGGSKDGAEVIDLSDSKSGSREIVPHGEHYALELKVKVLDDDATLFENFMSNNTEWKTTQQDDGNFLLTAVFPSSIDNILAWDFSGSGIEGLEVVSLRGYEVPEPSSLALILCGLVGGYAVWRRNRVTAKANA
ncbi:MAG: PEP-CTERM sorting domain-containing protein [Planctomycetia bacterium]|nr:PEP-CTERM sorting domain-containing protein [Planctomycetia bacterium]